MATVFFLVIGFYKVPYYVITIVLFTIYIVYVFVVWLEERKKETIIGSSKSMTHPSDMMDSNALITQDLENSVARPEKKDLMSKLTLEEDADKNEPLLPEDLEEREKAQGNYMIVLTQASQRELPDSPQGSNHDMNHLDVPNYEEEHEARDSYRHRKSSVILEGNVS